MLAAADIDALIAALRRHGVPVDLAQRLRLDRLLLGDGRMPDAASLPVAVAALLARTQQEHDTIVRIAAPFADRIVQASDGGDAPPRRPAATSPSEAAGGELAPTRSVRHAWAISATLALIALAVVALVLWPGDIEPPPPPPPLEGAPVAGPTPAAPECPPRGPTPDVVYQVTVPYLGPLDLADVIARALLAVFAAMGFAWQAGISGWLRRLWRRRSSRAGARPVDPCFSLEPPSERYPILDAEAREAIVWSMSSVEAELSAIDTYATVRATAERGGLPTLVWQRPTHLRPLWLLADLNASDPVGDLLIDELAALCAASGLPVRRFAFDRTLEELCEDGQGMPLTRLERDAHRATVVIVTDGSNLAERLRREDPGLCASLREIRAWPRRVVVDVTFGRHGLQRLLTRRGIPVIGPLQLVDWLRFGEIRPAVDHRRGVRTWAVAYGIGLQPASAIEALALRHALAPVWHDAPPALVVARVLEHLHRGDLDNGALRETDPELHTAAVEHWRERLGSEARRREALHGEEWCETPARSRFVALDAWLELEAAAEADARGRERALDRLRAAAIGGQSAFVEHALGCRVARRSDDLTPATPDVARARARVLLRAPGDRLALYGPRAAFGGIVLGAILSMGDAWSTMVRHGLHHEIVTLVSIPGGIGCFGSDPLDWQRTPDEAPPEVARVSRFTLTGTEVTLRQYRAWGGEPAPECTIGLHASHPVSCVTWDEARTFCRSLGPGYDLPTGRQWEYAARRGGRELFDFDGDGDQLAKHAWFAENSADTSHYVASTMPSTWRLWGLHGNVAEWVLDGDPFPAPDADRRAVRGGSYRDDWVHLRAPAVTYLGAQGRYPHIGFRCAGPGRPEAFKKSEPLNAFRLRRTKR